MSTIQSMYQQFVLAEAAYANLWATETNSAITNWDDVKSALIAKGMGDTQAENLHQRWEVVDHVPDLNSGFSATLFRSLDDPGHYTLAIRGSLELIDFTTDAALINTDGIAVEQLVDLYNFWQRAMTPAGETYTAARLTPNPGAAHPVVLNGMIFAVEFVDSSQLANEALQTGSGSIGALMTDLDVTGHSLGGHLAMAFTRLFPAFGAQALVVNGLGFKLDESTVNNLFAALSGANGFNAGQIQNLYGIAGYEFAAMDNMALQQPGGYDGIFIESAGLGTWGGHSGTQMTDSMAVYAAYAQVAPYLTVDAITSILNASANDNSLSLEIALDKLRYLIQGPLVVGTVPEGPGEPLRPPARTTYRPRESARPDHHVSDEP